MYTVCCFVRVDDKGLRVYHLDATSEEERRQIEEQVGRIEESALVIVTKEALSR